MHSRGVLLKKFEESKQARLSDIREAAAKKKEWHRVHCQLRKTEFWTAAQQASGPYSWSPMRLIPWTHRTPIASKKAEIEEIIARLAVLEREYDAISTRIHNASCDLIAFQIGLSLLNGKTYEQCRHLMKRDHAPTEKELAFQIALEPEFLRTWIRAKSRTLESIRMCPELTKLEDRQNLKKEILAGQAQARKRCEREEDELKNTLYRNEQMLRDIQKRIVELTAEHTKAKEKTLKAIAEECQTLDELTLAEQQIAAIKTTAQGG